MLQGKQYCMTPSKHSSGKRRSGVISILIRLIGAGCLWCALKALTEDLFKKSCLRGESMCTLINKTSYSCWRMGNSFMQSLTLKHLLVVDVVRTFRKKIVFLDFFLMQIWNSADIELLQQLRWSSFTKLPCICVFLKGKPLHW